MYFDTSALVKLVVDEPETDALRSWIEQEAVAGVSSDLARTELVRAVRRVDSGRAVLARAVLHAIGLVALDAATLDAAGRLDPASLRSLHALHLASALSLGDELAAFVTYDSRLAEAAANCGLPVVAPGHTPQGNASN